ncbi:MAG: DNA-directed RNA polymerase subunit H [Candidatus Thermoplasmatota archaeon]|nr:DNA-directed RNA polymerase subunit H [Candidatus Thermoplasmatota archaeon]
MHEMVPEHWLIPVKEEEKILKLLGVAKGQLPKIRKSDPVIKTLEKVEGEIVPGRIIQIVRKMVISLKNVFKIYRTVIGE